MDIRKGRSGSTIQSGGTAMGRCASALAVIAPNTQLLIDQQDVGCLAETLLEKKGN
jgi:hypothetical protein